MTGKVGQPPKREEDKKRMRAFRIYNPLWNQMCAAAKKKGITATKYIEVAIEKQLKRDKRNEK
jgi:predicted HicB family RNase H-like nuclease